MNNINSIRHCNKNIKIQINKNIKNKIYINRDKKYKGNHKVFSYTGKVLS